MQRVTSRFCFRHLLSVESMTRSADAKITEDNFFGAGCTIGESNEYCFLNVRERHKSNDTRDI